MGPKSAKMILKPIIWSVWAAFNQPFRGVCAFQPTPPRGMCPSTNPLPRDMCQAASTNPSEAGGFRRNGISTLQWGHLEPQGRELVRTVFENHRGGPFGRPKCTVGGRLEIGRKSGGPRVFFVCFRCFFCFVVFFSFFLLCLFVCFCFFLFFVFGVTKT